ncbi:MAG TPA: hypothetical protein VHV78_12940 [Gemmatimonadaceae bacterium]|jgi:hypothetical protein|nr:hypothetical protein [Gemmatimonadaceae bacterium]
MAQTRQLATASYLVGGALLFIPLIDATMQTLPLRFQDPHWRYGFFGLMSNAMMLTMLGLLIFFMTADYFEHRRFQRALGLLSIIAAVVLILVTGMFSLDVLQVHKDIQPRAALVFKVASATAFLKWVLAVLTLGAFGLASLRAPKVPKTAKERRSTGLVVGKATGVVGSGTTPALPAQESASAGAE